MSSTIRAWKDEEYRLSLSEAERSLLPESPVGSLELTDEELDGVGGGACILTFGLVCDFYTLVCLLLSIYVDNRGPAS